MNLFKSIIAAMGLNPQRKVCLTDRDIFPSDLYVMQNITQQVHETGGLILWDLCHSAGIFDIRLNEAQADFTVGCGYKFLNGGPDAPSYVYVAKRHQENISQPLSGWMGPANPFAFDETYESAPGIRRMLCGTPSIIAMSYLDIWRAIDTIKIIMEKETWRKFPGQKKEVVT